MRSFLSRVLRVALCWNLDAPLLNIIIDPTPSQAPSPTTTTTTTTTKKNNSQGCSNRHSCTALQLQFPLNSAPSTTDPNQSFTKVHKEKERKMSSSAADQNMFNYGILFLLITTPPTIIALRHLTVPYGKHQRPGWGPTIPAPLAWFLMESPTLWLPLLLFPLGKHRSNPAARFLILPYLLHYTHRTIIYPLRLRLLFLKTTTPSKSAAFPVTVAAMAFAFNLLNAYLQARWVSHYADYEGDRWFWWRFAGGLVVFMVGMAVNMRSDYALLRLKSQSGGGGYKIPRGGWFELVSCPNYLGEILEWLGWAVMNWSPAGLVFLLYTCANLLPRAASNHKWYLQKFGEDYPQNRKAVIPFVF